MKSLLVSPLVLLTLCISNISWCQTSRNEQISTGVLAVSEKPENRIPPVPAPNESFTSFTLEPGVRVTVQKMTNDTASTKPVHLILYLLPNGSTTEQTLGRSPAPNQDWHYAIQQIAAQTRRVRELLKDRHVITAVVEADTLSWPTWRRITDGANERIGQMVEEIRKRVGGPDATVDLVAHSGGGSFIWGYLNSQAKIPDYINRIVFIDANYSYEDDDHHGDKMLAWIRADDRHRLIVLCYDDRRITVNGKPVVSDTGGTWRATDRMARRLEKDVDFTSGTINDYQTSTALDGRIFLARNPNPANKILHTVLVEKNGFVFSEVYGREKLAAGDMLFSDEQDYMRLVLPRR